MEALKRGLLKKGREDELSLKILLLERSKSVVGMCCELLPFARSEGLLLEDCRLQLQGPVLREIEAMLRLYRFRFAEALILEMDAVDLEIALGVYVEGCHGALKELNEQRPPSGVLDAGHRQVVVDACAALCTLASECLGEVGPECEALSDGVCGVGEVLDHA